MGVEVKIDKLIDFINQSDIDEFLKFRFNSICQDMLFDEWKDISPYYTESSFLNIFEKVTNSQLFIPSEEERDDMEDEFTTYEAIEFKNAFVSFGIFMFKSYIQLCLKAFTSTHRGMSNFSKKIDSYIFERDYTDRIIEFFAYHRRDGNEGMEDESIDATTKLFKVLDKMAEMNFVYDFAKEMEDLDGTIEFVKDSYLCYLESIHLCFCHFHNDLNAMIFKEQMSTAKNKGSKDVL